MQLMKHNTCIVVCVLHFIFLYYTYYSIYLPYYSTQKILTNYRHHMILLIILN